MGRLMLFAGCSLLFGAACASTPGAGSGAGDSGEDPPPPGDSGASDDGGDGDLRAARVEAVDVTGSAGAYTFAVTVRSPDTGCERYADWWEVVRPSGELVYRRILGHSHVEEQPFTRTGGPVSVQPDDPLIVRVHMNPDGYGDTGRRGTAAAGFDPATQVHELAPELSNAEPQPDGCAF